MRVRFMLLTIEQANRLPSRVVGISRMVSRIFPSLEQTLHVAGLNVSLDNYMAAALISSIGYGLFFALFIGGLAWFSTGMIIEGVRLAVVSGLCAWLGSFVIHLIYPRILAQQKAAGVDEGLMYALRSLQIQVNSGVSLYDALTNVAKSGYGSVSMEFEKVVQEINAGVNEATALERLALRTDSQFLRKTIWQLVTSIRTGSPLTSTLQSIMATLTEYQSRAIKTYSAELNMWILMYLLIAAALPTIGITFMVILSSIGGSSITPDTIFYTLGGAFIVQLILIGLIRSRTPRGYST